MALCEFDYFKKLELICFSCNNALRGPYITALGNKYHLEHFKCAVCQKVFESDESYYEHEGNIFCHYHYSKLYASHCEGCHSSIVKQFVELFKGGRNQQWHPECYMVHKFWNVCILADSVGLQKLFNLSESALANLKAFKNDDDVVTTTVTTISTSGSDNTHVETKGIDPKLLLSIEQQIENMVMQCWLTLSGYEETTAASISDMLLNACTGNQGMGLLATGKLVLNVEVLFQALDCVVDMTHRCIPIVKERFPVLNEDPDVSLVELDYFQVLRKEPRKISGNLMSYLAILRKSSLISQSGSLSAELLSVITGCAHYLKLLIRIGLSNALKVNKLLGTSEATQKFLNLTLGYEKFNSVSEKRADSVITSEIDVIKAKLRVPQNSTDACAHCGKSIEKMCARFDNKRWHVKCFNCSTCSRNIPVEESNVTKYNVLELTIICKNCVDVDAVPGFDIVSDLSQLVYLLKIAISRSQGAMKVEIGRSQIQRNASLKEVKMGEDETEDNYSQTLKDVTGLRARRQSQKLSNPIKQNARKSVILESPQPDKAKQDEVTFTNLSGDHIEELSESLADVEVAKSSTEFNRKASAASHLLYIANGNEQFNVKKSLSIRDEPRRISSHLDRTTDLLKNEKSLTLDDIPRIVAAEQARDQRPNAFKHHNTLYQRQKPMNQSVKQMGNNGSAVVSPSTALDNILNGPVPQNQQEQPQSSKPKYYSELTKDEHFIMRHVAIEALIHISGNKYNKESLLSLIQTKKQPTFWDKFKFGGGEKREKNTAVFGVDLQDLTKRYGIDSSLGVGPSQLRIPIVVDDVINALRQKDMSVEGIFRLNGNIKRLRELTEVINKTPMKSPDFSSQNAVQLAALMKKWLRELPNPLLTHNLYELWISSQGESNLVTRKRILQLAYCMLPRSHRNLVEVLLSFFSWVASFAEIDEETGSKMDIHNLATVIAPNILINKQDLGTDNNTQAGDTYFLAIEVVNQLIEIHEEISIIPDDLLQFYERCDFSLKTEVITTKEIMHKLDKVSKESPQFFRQYEKVAAPDSVSNQMVHTNTITRSGVPDQPKVASESHGETSRVE